MHSWDALQEQNLQITCYFENVEERVEWKLKLGTNTRIGTFNSEDRNKACAWVRYNKIIIVECCKTYYSFMPNT